MQEYKVIVNDDGTIRWYKFGTGKLHRTDGPAIEWNNGAKEWWVKGKQYTEEEFNALILEKSMTVNEYQERAKQTAIFPKESGIVYCTLALNGEAGEVAEKVKKVIRDHAGEFDDEHRLVIAKELGDCAWYLANLADQIGYSLEEICKLNLEKLADRQQRGKLQGSGDDR